MGSDGAAAYVDSLPKITLLHGYPITFAGHSIVNGKFISKLIKDFNEKIDNHSDALKSFEAFNKYIHNELPEVKSKFIGGAFYKDEPTLFSIHDGRVDMDRNGFVFSEDKLIQYLRNYAEKALACDEYQAIFEKIIYQFAKDNGGEHFIGGGITTVKITKGNKVEWLKNDFRSNEVYDYTDYVDSIEKQKIKINLIGKNTLPDVVEFMKAGKHYRLREK